MQLLKIDTVTGSGSDAIGRVKDPTLLEDNSDAVAGSGYSYWKRIGRYWKRIRRCWKIIRIQSLEVDEAAESK